MASLEVALDYGQRVQRERCDPQMGLFGGADCPEPVNVPAMPDIEDWDERQKLAFEKESLGFFLSGHPLHRFEEVLHKFTTADALSIKEAPDGATVRIGGLVRGMKTIKTRKGDLMGFATIEDLHGAVEVTVFSRVFAAASDLLAEDRTVLVQGQVQKDEQSVKLIAETIIPLEKAEEHWTASVHLSLDLERHRPGAAAAAARGAAALPRHLQGLPAPARGGPRRRRDRASRRGFASRPVRRCGGTWGNCWGLRPWKRAAPPPDGVTRSPISGLRRTSRALRPQAQARRWKLKARSRRQNSGNVQLRAKNARKDSPWQQLNCRFTPFCWRAAAERGCGPCRGSSTPSNWPS